MGKPKAPTPPDPRQTAAAATGTNIGTAIANTNLQNMNQVGPGGSLTYGQTGSTTFTDPYTGQSYEIPQFTATTSLSPDMQRIFDGTTGAAGQLAQNIDTTPMGSFEDIRAQSLDALTQRMDPMIERDRQRMETQLANQGIGMGSRAFSASQDDMSRGVNDARLGAVLASGDEQSRAMQMDVMRRSQPISEIAALLGGSQMATPNYTPNRPAGIATTDVGGLINQNYQQRQQNYQNQMANWQGTMGGLFGMGSAFIGRPR